MKLAFPRLHVDALAVAGLIEWYCNRLGMSVIKKIKSEKELIHWVGYQNASQSAVVEVLQTATIV